MEFDARLINDVLPFLAATGFDYIIEHFKFNILNTIKVH